MLSGAVGIGTGSKHTCVVKTDGTVWCWGLNDRGQLGDNTTNESSTPVQVKGPGGTGTLTTVTEITAGLQHSCAVKTDGTVWCWGLNDKGQLGDNTTTDSIHPRPSQRVGRNRNPHHRHQRRRRRQHTCAVKTDGTVWCWGLNNKGQLGNNTTTDSGHPRPSQRTGRNRNPHHRHRDHHRPATHLCGQNRRHRVVLGPQRQRPTR